MLVCSTDSRIYRHFLRFHTTSRWTLVYKRLRMFASLATNLAEPEGFTYILSFRTCPENEGKFFIWSAFVGFAVQLAENYFPLPVSSTSKVLPRKTKGIRRFP